MVHMNTLVEWNVKKTKSRHEATSPYFNFPKTQHVVLSIQFLKAKHTDFGYAQMIDSVINKNEIQTVQATTKFVLNLSLSLILERPVR